LALDDFDDRFANAVKLALDVSRSSGDYQADAMEGAECPSSDMIASYYEDALNRVERARLESHFSGCALCQGTLAALLRAAPTLDTSSEPGHLARNQPSLENSRGNRGCHSDACGDHRRRDSRVSKQERSGARTGGRLEHGGSVK
jgi:hypothetical protein